MGYRPWGRKELDVTEQLAHCAALRRGPVLRELMVLGEEWGLKIIQGITIQCAWHHGVGTLGGYRQVQGRKL